ncbi:MAG: proline racemase family protein [Fimbriimonadaceae bacterium]
MDIHFIDTHAAGEPTRIIIDPPFDLGRGTMAERRDRFVSDFDHFRRGILLEPRGSDILVGALVFEPSFHQSEWGVIFFNNAGVLGMCGHGTMCVVQALRHLGRVDSETLLDLETPVGRVTAEIFEDNWVAVHNVASYRHQKDVEVCVGNTTVKGDIAYGGNWFFITHDSPCPVDPGHLTELTEYSVKVQAAIRDAGIEGADGGVIDHIEICVATETPGADSRNFVLCPGAAYDRSPCGTGTSAHMACLFADGTISEGQPWTQESVIGTTFEGSVTVVSNQILPVIRGRSFVTAEGRLIFDENDPLCYGI